MSDMSHLENDFDRAEFLRDTLIGFSTQDGIGGDAEDYAALRRHFLDKPGTRRLMPDWLQTKRNSNEFWQFIKHKFPSYRERREFIYAELEPLLSHCEGAGVTPADRKSVV